MLKTCLWEVWHLGWPSANWLPLERQLMGQTWWSHSQPPGNFESGVSLSWFYLYALWKLALAESWGKEDFKQWLFSHGTNLKSSLMFFNFHFPDCCTRNQDCDLLDLRITWQHLIGIWHIFPLINGPLTVVLPDECRAFWPLRSHKHIWA